MSTEKTGTSVKVTPEIIIDAHFYEELLNKLNNIRISLDSSKPEKVDEKDPDQEHPQLWI